MLSLHIIILIGIIHFNFKKDLIFARYFIRLVDISRYSDMYGGVYP